MSARQFYNSYDLVIYSIQVRLSIKTLTCFAKMQILKGVHVKPSTAADVEPQMQKHDESSISLTLLNS